MPQLKQLRIKYMIESNSNKIDMYFDLSFYFEMILAPLDIDILLWGKF